MTSSGLCASVIAGLFPHAALDIVRAIRDGRLAEARRLNAVLDPLWVLFRTHTSLRVMYACADMLGITDTAPPRPILPLPPATRNAIAEVLEALNLR